MENGQFPICYQTELPDSGVLGHWAANWVAFWKGSQMTVVYWEELGCLLEGESDVIRSMQVGPSQLEKTFCVNILLQWLSRPEAGLMSEATGRMRLTRWFGMLTAKIPPTAMAFWVSPNIPHLNDLGGESRQSSFVPQYLALVQCLMPGHKAFYRQLLPILISEVW